MKRLRNVGVLAAITPFYWSWAAFFNYEEQCWQLDVGPLCIKLAGFEKSYIIKDPTFGTDVLVTPHANSYTETE